MTESIKVFAISPHSFTLFGIEKAIPQKSNFELVGTTTTARKLFEVPASLRPQIVIFDIATQVKSRVMLFSEIKAAFPGVHIAALVEPNSPPSFRRAKRIGAHSIISKDVSIPEFVSILRSLLSNIKSSDRLYKPKKNLRSKSKIETILTQREIEVFEMIGQGFKTRKIAEDLGLSPKTIDSHCANLKAKLRLRNAAELAHRAFVWVHEGS